MRINEIRKKGSIESLVIALWRFAVLVKISNHNGNNKRFLFIHQKKCVKMNLPLSLYWIFGDWWTVNEQRAECVMDFFGLICVHTILIHSFAFGAKQSMAKPRKAKPIERKRNWAFCMQPNAYTVRNCLCVCVCAFFLGKIDPYWSVRQQNLSISFQQLHKWFAAWTFPSWFVCDTCSLNQNMNSAFLARTGGTCQIQWTQSEEISDWFVVEPRATEKRARRLHRSV